MQYLGIPYEMKHIPQLDPGFIPFGIWMKRELSSGNPEMDRCFQLSSRAEYHTPVYCKPLANGVEQQRIDLGNTPVSDAEAEAAKLEAEGEAEYMRMLAEAYDSDDKKDFYEFTIALDALQQSLTGNEKTIILDEDSPLAKILMGAGN